ncbi:radical SAM protein [Streptomyces sp. SID10853]|uniref:radical SAM/SPASM domain-containing protein n=1 Tax=Streptomyces sp. SID10853 TaxID=2706028 RepID=UPI0013C03247|nr:radical SAM/SPASM domain-containing protein [Streptomyces sp. SID10853]NDZ78380.1 radical SAM protein [Streptomyces sp. SID10853]
MTLTVDTPALKDSPADGILSVECELTGRCQLECSHCCTLSGPKVSHGMMSLADWRNVVDDIAAVAVPAVQFIGGEPTLSPALVPLIGHALGRSLAVEVYSNLTHVRPALWAALDQTGVRVATSYYSDDPEQHDRITGGRGSHARTLANITEVLNRGIQLRVGLVDLGDGQRVAEAEAQLRSLGVQNIRVDKVRSVGRAAPDSTTIPSVNELCGRCFHERVAVSPDGDVYGCILSRHLRTGNVRTARLRDVLAGPQWADARSAVPKVTTNACPPNDGGDCSPASTPACNPKF